MNITLLIVVLVIYFAGMIGIGVFGMWYALINMGKWKPRQKTAAKFYVRSASLAGFY